jgi:hypothetical protein
MVAGLKKASEIFGISIARTPRQHLFNLPSPSAAQRLHLFTMERI